MLKIKCQEGTTESSEGPRYWEIRCVACGDLVEIEMEKTGPGRIFMNAACSKCKQSNRWTLNTLNIWLGVA